VRIGITGQPGFIGTHLANWIRFCEQDFELESFEDAFFDDIDRLTDFVQRCDAVVHLAGVNRDPDPEFIYRRNVELAKLLAQAMERAQCTPHVVMSSSIQERRDNPYGRGKHDARQILVDWSRRTGALFTGLLIPNVFGPFGRPYYNSVVATFAHQAAHDETPQIQTDGEIPLIYVTDLVRYIVDVVRQDQGEEEREVTAGTRVMVSEIKHRLEIFAAEYIGQNTFPVLAGAFDVNLFNTFRAAIPHSQYPVELTLRTDDRGYLTEALRTGTSGQVFYSVTRPGITRGNHFHTRKLERFCVLRGKARIRLRRVDSDEVITYDIDGAHPAVVDMPVWHTHNLTNIGDDELIMLFWTNEFFDPNNPDTIYVEV